MELTSLVDLNLRESLRFSRIHSIFADVPMLPGMVQCLLDVKICPLFAYSGIRMQQLDFLTLVHFLPIHVFPKQVKSMVGQHQLTAKIEKQKFPYPITHALLSLPRTLSPV